MTPTPLSSIEEFAGPSQQADSFIGELNDQLENVKAENDDHVAVVKIRKKLKIGHKSMGKCQKSKRGSSELIGNKESKNDANIKVIDFSASEEPQISELEAELQCLHVSLAKEKEVDEKHQIWVTKQLTAIGDMLLEQGKEINTLKEDMSCKLADFQRKHSDNSTLLKLKDKRVKELESKLEFLQKELSSCKVDAAAIEGRFSAELASADKLAKLYKEYSDEYSEKARELEEVIKAFEKDYEKEKSARIECVKEASGLKEKLEKCEAELESYRNSYHLNRLQMRNFNPDLYDNPVSPNDSGGQLMLVEEVWTRIRGDIITLQSQRDRLILEMNFAEKKLKRFMEQVQKSGFIARNDEFWQLIVDSERRLGEFSENLRAAEEMWGVLNKEERVLKCEHIILSPAEKRAWEEVRSLSVVFSQLIVDYHRRLGESFQFLQAARAFVQMQKIEMDEEDELVDWSAYLI